MITAICAVMNREPSLRIALASWLCHDEISQIVITDWCSTLSLNRLVELDPRVTVIRVDGEPHFHRSAALNLAMDRAQRDRIMQLDAEYVLNPYYRLFEHVTIEPGEFVCGQYAWREKNPYHQGLTGFLYVHTASLRAVNGWNERMHGWGWEDQDVYARLRQRGLRQRLLPYDHDYVCHLPHPGGLRVANYECKDCTVSNSTNKRLSQEGRYTRRLYEWDYEGTGRWFRARRRANG